MRARGLLKGNAAPSLCIFCASRFLAEQLQPAITTSSRHRRLLNTTRPPYQAAASAAQAIRSNDSERTSSKSWHPDSDLTAAERTEKQRRLQQQAIARREAEQTHGQRTADAQSREKPGDSQIPRESDIIRSRQHTGSQFTLRPGSTPSPQGDREQKVRSEPHRRAAPPPETRYRATIVKPSQHPIERPSPASNGRTGEWQHLSRGRKAQNASNSSSAPDSRATAYPLADHNRSDDTIDRAFAEHRMNRRPPSVPIRFPYARSAIVPCAKCGKTNHRTEECGRTACYTCGQQGHLSRDCSSRVCGFCGQAGHVPAHCPKKTHTQYSLFASQRHIRRETASPAVEQGQSAAESDYRGRPSSARASMGDEKQETAPLAAYQPFYSDSPIRANKEERVESIAEIGGEVVRTNADVAEQRQQDRRAERLRRGFADEEVESDIQTRSDARSRRSGRKVVNSRDDDDADDEAAYLREQRAAQKAARKAARKAEKAAEKREAATTVNLPEFISVSQLAQTLGVHYEHFVERLEDLGYDDVFPGKVLNTETSGMIAMEYNFEPVFEDGAEELEEEERDLKPRPEVDDKSSLPTRPPVVTIMGHVDHGKTTILDYLRKSSIAAGEAGGITQHIGAFSVDLSGSGKSITFLDTPGHAAFLAMRQRGANVTDIVVLVVAADDSVKPQTIESIRCAREAGVPILVAINKIDKEAADIQKVKNDLARNGVEIEDFGGDTQVVCVSGKTGKGMEELEEAAVTLSEILDHRAETDGEVEGWLLEATTKKAGRVATVLVKRGTLRPGTVIVAGKTWARVRTLRNEAGQIVHEATPGTPIEVDGWRDQPVAGDQVLQAPSEQKATDVVEYRIEKEERARTAQDMEVINEARRAEQEKRMKEKAEERAKKAGAEIPVGNITSESDPEEDGGQLTVPFIIKADVSGSAEAVSAYIPSLSSPLITPHILSSGVGAVHESDIEFAATAQGHIIAFNLPSDAEAKASAEARGVQILENNIIYRVLDDVKAILEEKLPPLISQRVLGEAEISAMFDIKLGGRKVMWIAGCKVRNGVIGKGSRARVMRGSEKVYDGTLNSLKNVKKDVQEMRKGTECGMGFEGWEGFQVGDVVQTYEEVSEKRKL